MRPTPPVTEFAILRLKERDPELYAHLRRASAEQSSWSSFPLHWFSFTTKDDPSTFICILSQWASVPAHQAWIDSDQNQALLTLLAPTLEITSFCHIALKLESGDIDTVLGAQSLRWKRSNEEIKDVAQSAAFGWTVDAPNSPAFYAFEIVDSGVESIKDGDWTTMSRLDISNA